MKKLLIILLIVLTLFSTAGCCIFKAANIYTRTELDADGNEIKVEVMYNLKDKSDIWLERYYNKDGWLEKEISYENYKAGKIAYVTIFRANGSKVSTETFYHDDNARSFATFDENDNPLTCHNYKNNMLTSVEEFYPSGKRSKLTDYTDPTVSVRIWTYAENEMITSYYTAWSEDARKLTQLDLFENEVRVSSEITITTFSGEFVQHYVDEFEANGNPIRTIHYDENGEIYDISYHH